MTGHDHPEAPPPEVPEEFAAAYRDAYRRALEANPEEPAHEPVLSDAPLPDSVPVAVPAPTQEPQAGHPLADLRSSRWFLPVVVGASALVLVVAAYGVGLAVSGDDAPEDAGTVSPSAAHSTTPHRDASAGVTPTRSEPSTPPGSWEGAVTAVAVDAISADCTAPPSNDSAGRRVTYVPENAIDDKPQSAWRCAGTAVGQKLTLRIRDGAEIAEVGLIPGYAKTDPESGVDRYAENNRITRVRWTIGDDVTVVQRLDADPSSRAVQLVRVPRTDADTITLEILAVKRGPRNTTAISEIQVAAARD